MPLTFAQRRERLGVRVSELGLWRVRGREAIGGWTLDAEPIAVGGAWPSAEGTVRFAAQAEGPADWPLNETRLSLDLGGESLLTLAYQGGATRSFGLDPYHFEFPLDGRHLKISAESVARLPFGQPVHHPRLNRAEFIRIDTAVETFEALVKLLAEAMGQLEGHDAAEPMLAAAEEAMRALDWPSTTADYVARVAPSPAQRTIWRLPASSGAPAALDDAQRAGVVAATDALRARLRHLQKAFPPSGAVSLTGHAHIDLAWLWPYDETRRKMRRTFSTAVELMERFPDFRFNQSTAHYYAQMEADDPKLLDVIKSRVKAGQWETIGGLWIEPDTNMPTGESLVRQALYGQRYFEREFGARHKVCWLPDCFGFSPAMPQILRQAGMDSFFTIKVNWSETNRFPFDLFWWEGLDGSKVLAHTFDNPINGYNGEVRPDATAPTWRNYRGKASHPETLLAVGYGDGGGGTTREMIEAEAILRDFPALPRAHWGTVHGFYEGAHASAAQKALPTWAGEIYLELHRGTLTTQSAVKKKHRLAERALITAETLASLAHLMGAPPPKSLEPLWRVVLKNEFHDILPGSSIAEVYRDAGAELDGVIAAGALARGAAMADIVASRPKGGVQDALVVVNPSLSARSLTIEEGGTTISTTDEVPPLGVAVFDRAALPAAGGLKGSADTLENKHLRAVIGEDGTIASLMLRATGREALSGRGNQLWVYSQDKPRAWDAWEIDEDYSRSGVELTAVEGRRIVDLGAHRIGIEVKRRWRSSTVTQLYTLTANGRRLDIRTHIDWRDRRAFLRSLTPAAVRARHATFECALGVIERPTGENTSWEAAQFEVCAHRFADIGEPGFGLALLNDAKYGHSAKGSTLGLSLLRSPVYPDPLADEGGQSFTYALMPHAGAWHEVGVREEAEDLNQPLVSVRAHGLAAGVATPLAVAGVPVALSGFKAAEDGKGLVLRVYEPAGGRGDLSITPPPGWRVSGAVTLLEEPMAVEATAISPFELRSWRLERA